MWRRLSLLLLFSVCLLVVVPGIAFAHTDHGAVPLQEPQPQAAPAPPPQPPMMAEPAHTEPGANMGGMDMHDSKTEKRRTTEKRQAMMPGSAKETHAKDAGGRFYLNSPGRDGFGVAAFLTLVVVALFLASLRPRRIRTDATTAGATPPTHRLGGVTPNAKAH